MEFKFAHLADFATEDRGRKLVLVGIFEGVVTMSDARPITIPPISIVARFAAHITEGVEHELELRCTDADGNDVLPRLKQAIRFEPEGPRRNLRGQIIVRLNNLRVPDVGDYAFHFFIDGRRYGDLPMSVTQVASPTPPAAPPTG